MWSPNFNKICCKCKSYDVVKLNIRIEAVKVLLHLYVRCKYVLRGEMRRKTAAEGRECNEIRKILRSCSVSKE